jgi:hypothetical protein
MRASVLFLLLALLPLSLPEPAEAQERAISLESFHADVQVLPDGRILVTEALEVAFQGEWNGIEREISLRHETAQGRRARLALEVTAVTDGAGSPLRYEELRGTQRRTLRIWVPGAVNATRSVQVEYQVPNALRFFHEGYREGGHDELYWNVTGNEWEMEIRRASAEIRLPEGAREVEAWAYTGPAGSTEQDARVEIQGPRVRVTSHRPLAEKEGLTVSVVWAPGVINRELAAASQGEGILVPLREDRRLFVPALAVLTLLLVSLLARRAFLRDGGRPRALTAQYEPPGDLTPAESSLLLHRVPKPAALGSTLVDLAVRGHLLIEEVERKRWLGLSTTTDYVFHMRTPSDEWESLAPHERQLMRALFRSRGSPGLIQAWQDWKVELDRATAAAEEEGRTLGKEDKQTALKRFFSGTDDRTSIRLSRLRGRLGMAIPTIHKSLYDRLTERGFLRRRGRLSRFGESLVVGVPFLALFALFFVSVVGFGPLGSQVSADLDPMVLFASLGLGVVTLIVLGPLLHRNLPPTGRSPEGVRTLELVLGFREFLARVETDRFRRMITSPALFERYLPYAMAFEVEDKWVKAFESLNAPEPEWYVGRGQGSLRTGDLARGLSRMSRQAGSAMRSGGSSRSGSGGGGSSGGGSGGGGGRGF